MANKKIKLGSLIKERKKNKNGTEYDAIYIGLGQKNPKSPQYNFSVELVVKDSKGNVVATQKDGFIELSDPRTKPDQLLEIGVISEEQAEKMKDSASRMPEKVKYELLIKGL